MVIKTCNKELLNPVDLTNHLYKKGLVTTLIFLVFISFGCGKRKIPLPPVKTAPQQLEFTGIQRGNQIYLSWIINGNNSSSTDSSKIKRVDIYRLIESLSDSLTLSEEEFASRSVLIATIPIPEANSKPLSFVDNLEFAGQPARLRYALRTVNSEGQKAVFSNFLLIEPAANIALNPTALIGETSQNAINLKWTEPVSNIDESKPANVLGYNIYKSVKNGAAKVINETPVKENSFADKLFDFDQNYTYFIRAVSLGINGNIVESLSSNTLEITPVDTFAPNSPGAVTIAAAPNNLSLFFAANSENDLAGYRIYRSTDLKLPRAEWKLLNIELLTTNTFQDKDIETGVTYYYILTAVDKKGNVSEPSDVISETAP